MDVKLVVCVFVSALHTICESVQLAKCASQFGWGLGLGSGLGTCGKMQICSSCECHLV